MILSELNKKFNKIFIILLIICSCNILLYNYKTIYYINKESYMNAHEDTTQDEKVIILKEFKTSLLDRFVVVAS